MITPMDTIGLSQARIVMPVLLKNGFSLIHLGMIILVRFILFPE
jgi:hypothetical protein